MQRVSASSYGTLLATAAMSAAKTLKGRTEFSAAEISSLVEGAMTAMMARGKGALGDKTVLDTLDAIATATRDVPSDAMYDRARAAALETLEAFKDKPNKLGRARMFADASVGRYDPGQLALARILQALAG
jgi:dihydroxyacetone kinase-like protein